MSDDGTAAPSQPDKLIEDRAIIDSIKTEMATAKGAVEEIQRTTMADAATITKARQDIEKLKVEAEGTATQLQEKQKKVENHIAEFDKKREALQQVLTEIERIKTTAEESNDSVSEAIAEIQTAKTNFENLATQTQASHDDLANKKGAADNQIKEIAKAHQSVKEIYETLFTDVEGKPSIKTSINELQKSLITTYDAAKADRLAAEQALKELNDKITAEKDAVIAEANYEFSDLKKALGEKILSLLPSAGAAGLASTYYDAKSKYGVTQFHSVSDDPMNRGSFLQRFVAHDPASMVATIVFYIMFLGPIIVIIVLFYDLIEKMVTLPPGVVDRYLIARTLVAIPLGTVSLFGYTSLRLYRRLYEEYNYKQRVMELYTSFSKEIEAKGDDDQVKTLIAIMLKAVADKPSLGMHRYDGVGQKSGVKFDINQLIDRFFNKTNSKSES